MYSVQIPLILTINRNSIEEIIDMKSILCFICLFLFLSVAFTQNHWGAVSGVVSFRGIRTAGATITLRDNGTGTVYATRSNASGTYGIYHLSPASQYQITVSFPDADTIQIQLVQVIAGEDLQIHFSLQPAVNILTPIIIQNKVSGRQWRNGITILSDQSPHSQHWSNLFLHEPSATVKNDGSGAISFSGQRYRANAFYIDGILQNDPFGLSPSGILNGESGQGPAALESIEQITLMKSPLDASLGNFTGAVVQLVSRRGSNQPRQEIYSHTKANYQQYSHKGINISGPVIRNKIFFFLNTEFISSQAAFSYDSSQYKGETRSVEKLNRLRQTMMEQFHYDPGTTDQLAHYRNNKISLRIDAHLNKQHQISITGRWNEDYREQAFPQHAVILSFSNNIKYSNQQQLTVSAEWKKSWRNQMQNRFSFYFNQHHRNTLPKIQAYPTIRILDGEGIIVMGANDETYQNRSQQKSVQIINRLQWLTGMHLIEAGIDFQFHQLNNNFIPNGHGTYFYFGISDFVQNRKPAEFIINQKTREWMENDYLSGIHQIKKAVFLNYRLLLKSNMQLQTGVRLQRAYFINANETDSFTQHIALPVLSSYYQTGQLHSGQLPHFNWSIAPRLQWIWQLPKWNSTIKIGSGIFTGTIPNSWLSGIQSNNGNKIVGITAKGNQLNGYFFTPPHNNEVPTLPVNFTSSKGTVYISSNELKLPSIWRSVISWEQRISEHFSVETELLYYRQKTETGFKNINITRPNTQLSGADQRWIYHPDKPVNMALQSNGMNPYQQIMLIHNLDSIKPGGYQWQLQTVYNKAPIRLMLNYSFGKSAALYDGNYTNTLHYWRLQENTNGRNYPTLAISDFSQGHRIHASLHWQNNATQKKKTSISLHYSGQQGGLFSYVYGENNLSGDDPTSVGYDLIYIPRTDELSSILFKPTIFNGWYFGSEEQRKALDNFIGQDSYLRKRRGKYAEKNGSRSPFYHRVDLSMQKQFYPSIQHIKLKLTLNFELINLLGLINKDWGQERIVPGNRIPLIGWEGWADATRAIPQYSFDPGWLNKSLFEPNFQPGYHKSGNWQFQTSLRLSFY